MVSDEQWPDCEPNCSFALNSGCRCTCSPLSLIPTVLAEYKPDCRRNGHMSVCGCTNLHLACGKVLSMKINIEKHVLCAECVCVLQRKKYILCAEHVCCIEKYVLCAECFF